MIIIPNQIMNHIVTIPVENMQIIEIAFLGIQCQASVTEI